MITSKLKNKNQVIECTENVFFKSCTMPEFKTYLLAVPTIYLQYFCRPYGYIRIRYGIKP